MTIRRSSHFLIICALLLVTGARRARAQQPAISAEQTSADWMKRLSAMHSTDADVLETILRFSRGDPEMVFATLRDGWMKIPDDFVRSQLLRITTEGGGVSIQTVNGVTTVNDYINPHMLDILSLGVHDSMQYIRNMAFRTLFSVAFRDFTQPDDVAAWRESVRNVPLERVVRDSLTAYLASIASAPPDRWFDMLSRLRTVSFSDGMMRSSTVNNGALVVLAAGLTAARRKVAQSSGLARLIVRTMERESALETRGILVTLLAAVAPDPEDLQQVSADLERVLPPLIDSPQYRDRAIFVLGRIQAPWTTDLMLKAIVQLFPDRAYLSLIMPLGESHDPRCIPTLVAILDSDDTEEWAGYAVNDAICRLTGVHTGYSVRERGEWWKAWWAAHRSAFPTARTLPYPRLKSLVSLPGGVSVRRGVFTRSVAGEPGLSYLLVSPGIITTSSNPDHAQSNGPAQRGASGTQAAPHPGLMVVLADAPDTADASAFWDRLATKAFGRQFLLAVAAPPAGTAAWTPANVAKIVRDVSARYPIDAGRVYLHGEGSCGMEAWACALAADTPFKGFLILSSPFRSAQLPPISQARGRKVYLIQSRSSKSAPYFAAEAAAQYLNRSGAKALLAPPAVSEGYNGLDDVTIAGLAGGMQWLERGAGATDGRGIHKAKSK